MRSSNEKLLLFSIVNILFNVLEAALCCVTSTIHAKSSWGTCGKATVRTVSDFVVSGALALAVDLQNSLALFFALYSATPLDPIGKFLLDKSQ